MMRSAIRSWRISSWPWPPGGLLLPARLAGIVDELNVVRPAAGEAGGQAQRWPEIPLLEQFTATDDRGTRYRMRVRDLGGGADGWTSDAGSRPAARPAVAGPDHHPW